MSIGLITLGGSSVHYLTEQHVTDEEYEQCRGQLNFIKTAHSLIQDIDEDSINDETMYYFLLGITGYTHDLTEMLINIAENQADTSAGISDNTTPFFTTEEGANIPTVPSSFYVKEC